MSISTGEAGIEPATPGFGDRCSSQLSYSPKLNLSSKHQSKTIKLFMAKQLEKLIPLKYNKELY